jgi:hypothetical protein
MSEYATNIARHLSELSSLVSREVRREDLLPLAEADKIREDSKKVQYSPSWSTEIPFARKTEVVFQDFVRKLERLNANPVYVWTPASNQCGLLRPIPLHDLNFGFDFSINPEGILVVLTSDLRDRLLLDYSRDAAGQEVLEIEASGEHWGHARLE